MILIPIKLGADFLKIKIYLQNKSNLTCPNVPPLLVNLTLMLVSFSEMLTEMGDNSRAPLAISLLIIITWAKLSEA